tara:strand:+ start:350 stop:1132 length:783 start_codon:yes stop_codon:yes gene_type:complete
MTVTIEQLKQTAEICRQLDDYSKSSLLISIANYFQKNGKITESQIECASRIIETFTEDAVVAKTTRREYLLELWNNYDEDFLLWLDFLTSFYASNLGWDRPNAGHVVWYKKAAQEIRCSLAKIKKEDEGETPRDIECPIKDIERLYGSKLYDKLRASYETTPLYGVGDLVSVRGRKPTFGAWKMVNYSHHGFADGLTAFKDRKVAEPYRTALVTEVLNATFACRQVHKSKGSTRLYKIVAFSGGQQDECWVCESDIKLVK